MQIVDRKKVFVSQGHELRQFTCKKCGGHELILTHLWTIQVGDKSEQWREWGRILGDHHWRYQFKEKLEDAGEDRVQRGDYGEFVEEDSDSGPETYEMHAPQTDRENDEFYVNCGSCDREVEFGWSQPDRRGLILPAELADFVPTEGWPDPKYIAAWQRRGWLRNNTPER